MTRPRQIGTQLISFPFKLDSNGYAVTKTDGDVDYFGEILGVLVSTVPGERILVPTYGMEDPAFDSFPVATLMSQIDKFGPPVTIVDVTQKKYENDTADIIVYFQLDSDADATLGGQ